MEIANAICRSSCPTDARDWGKKYPVIFYIPGAAWHKQEMYNDLPKLADLAKKGFAIVSIEVRESDAAVFPAQIEDVKNATECVVSKDITNSIFRLMRIGSISWGIPPAVI